MKFLIFIIFSFSFLAKASLISVASSNDNSGMFFYSVSSGTAPFYFGGYVNMLKVVIPSAGVLNTYGPEGWYATVDENNIVTWSFTNSYIGFINTSNLVFCIKSVYTLSTNYSGPTGTLWQKGYASGDIYNTNYFLYERPLTNGIASMNVTGYEKFNFVGPLIPEPFYFRNLLIFTIFLFRRFLKIPNYFIAIQHRLEHY